MPWSPEFQEVASFTAKKTFEHREPDLIDIDPELAEELGCTERVYYRSLWGEWAEDNLRFFSGYTDEGGELVTIKLEDGNTLEFNCIGHLNIERNIDEPLQRHLLSADGEIYRGDKQYSVMSPAEVQQFIHDLPLAR